MGGQALWPGHSDQGERAIGRRLGRGRVGHGQGVQCLICITKDNKRETRMDMERSVGEGNCEAQMKKSQG